METKICSQCHIEKKSTEFYSNELLCKKCKKENVTKYRRTKDGLITRIYSSQKSNSKLKGNRPPEYTKQELKDWLYSQTLFHCLFSEWKNSGYLKRLTPSVDRKNDYIHYCMRNIQLMSWEENKNKSHTDVREGRNNKISKTVVQYDILGNFIKEFHSAHYADRELNIDSSAIIKACKGKQKLAGGYIWKYKNLEDNNG